MSQLFTSLFLALLTLSIFGCNGGSSSTSTSSTTSSQQSLTCNNAAEYASWLQVQNAHLADVCIQETSLEDEKFQFTLDISPAHDNVNWLIKFNDTELNDYNLQGTFNVSLNDNERFEIIFVEGEIDRSLEGTSYLYRYDYNWDISYTQSFLRDVYTNVQDAVTTDAPYLLEVFQNTPVYLEASASASYVGITSGSITLNAYKYNRYTLERLSGAYAHELAHAYELANNAVSKSVETLFANAKWNDSKGYYATNQYEMFSCALTQHIYPGNTAAHNIVYEPYYQEAILPFIDSLTK